MRFICFSLIFLLSFVSAVQADVRESKLLLKEAAAVMRAMMNAPAEDISSQLISKAQAVIVIPGMLKGGLLVGIHYGQGVASVRSSKTGLWGPPAFMTTMGGSIGLQVGGESVDLVLLVMTTKGVEGLLKDTFTLGGDMSYAVGPVGRYGELGADILFKGEVYSYSRSKGIFAGLSLKGAVIKPNYTANKEYYGEPLPVQEILMDNTIDRSKASSVAFIKSLNQVSPPPYKPRVKKFAGLSFSKEQ